jgi:hypothetical protein
LNTPNPANDVPAQSHAPAPGDNYNLMNSHVIPAMIRKFHLAKLATERNWSAIEQDEARHGPIPQDLKDHLLATCSLNLRFPSGAPAHPSANSSTPKTWPMPAST